MKLKITLTTLLMLVFTMSAEDKSEEGFTSLFDGKSFAGWQTTAKTPKSWKVENGLLVLKGGNSHLFTKKEYKDFVIRLEWRAEKKGYNSGFYVRGKNQINLAQKDAGRLLGHKNAKRVPEMHKPPGEWNQWEVTCIGPKVTLKVNGKVAWSIDNFKPTQGPIGIQAEGRHIDFRNIRIQEK